MTTKQQLTGLQQAFLTIQKLKEKLAEKEQAEKEPIAIIGIGCRFPGGANTPQAFWELLRNGVDAVAEIPVNRWNINNADRKIYTPRGGFLDHIDQFDPQFFNISPREATTLDPQQRILLEICWEALENAGIDPTGLANQRVGVFAGMGPVDFGTYQATAGNTAEIDLYSGSGTLSAFGSGRISYTLGLQGPSLTLDTACSSSLVAVHLACQSLRNKESRIALAGGVQIILLPETYIFLSQAGALSSDGYCKTFDASADGYVRSEGCGIVVLKRYTDAISDGDNILAVIRGSAVNHGGAATGLTVPNGRAQVQVIKDALANAGIDPMQVSYIEAHGTGTALGDPIEVEALTQVYGNHRLQPLQLGAVKTNIGHAEAAAGIASLIKVILALQHKQLPKHLHFNQPSPHIPWTEIPLKVVTEHTDWQPANSIRIAGISAFGMSGTNAHIILAEAPAIATDKNHKIKRSLHVFTLTAKTNNALQQLAQQYLHYLQTQPEFNIADICYTTNVGRAHFAHRLAICVKNRDELTMQLQAFLDGNGKKNPGLFLGDINHCAPPQIIFICKEFTDKFPNFSSELYETQPIFRRAVQQCDAIIKSALSFSLMDDSFTAKEIPQTLTTESNALLCFVLQYALVELWRAWGVVPQLVVTQETGKYIGQYIAGIFTLEEILQELTRRPAIAAPKIPQVELTTSLSALNNISNSFIMEINAAAIISWQELLDTLANIYVKGIAVNWQGFNQGYQLTKVVLPTYTFERKRYWPETSSSKNLDKLLPPANENNAGITEITLAGTSDTTEQTLASLTMSYLRQVFSESLKIPVTELDSNKTYEVFGMDSLVGKEITMRLEHDLGIKNATLLFEKNRLKDLSAYLQENYRANLFALQQRKQLPQPHITPDKIKRSNSITDISSVKDGYEPIAIIGLNGRYPLADDLDSFWENLKAGRDCITPLPANRWQSEAYPVNNKVAEDLGGFINDVDKFDPLFFNISPGEASVIIDPQERLFLQTAWSTFEDAGYTREKFAHVAQNKVGVYVGVTYHYYPLYIAEEWAKNNRLPLTIQFYSMANRLSYFMNFTGPSMPVDTACSSSLAAIHLACESIRRGECMMALAGGVNLSLHPAKYYTLRSAGFMSEQGRCASFAADGSGYIPGEGVGAVLLKPLALALRDGDQIYGVIRATAMNHDGKTSGFTVPNPTAQAELITDALIKANIDPRTISYIEAHGTGTSLGDPIEIKGLQNAFARFTEDKQFCAIGSVKSNIGHLESAAGISQLTKVLLQFRHQTLAPSIHADTLNPYIDFAETPFYVQRELAEWRTTENMPRRAGVSSFGAGGVNLHLIVEEHQPGLTTPSNAFAGPFLFVLSAQTPDLLSTYVQRFIVYLQNKSSGFSETDKQQWLANICYSLQTGREAMPARLALVVDSVTELSAKLRQFYQQPAHFFANGMASQQITSNDEAIAFTSADLQLISKQWLAGHPIMWDILYSTTKPKHITLPTYPFAKRRCWIPGQNYFNDEQFTSIQEVKQTPAEMNEWLYVKDWERQNAVNFITEPEQGYWLVFGETKINKSLAAIADKKSIIYCRWGKNYQQKGERNFIINSHHYKDYQRLFADLHKQAILPDKIIYFGFSAQHQHAKNSSVDLFHESFNADQSGDWLTFLQALVVFNWTKKPKLWIISQGAQIVNKKDSVAIWQYPLQSFISIFAMEQPEFAPKLIDLDATQSIETQLKLLKQILHAQISDVHFALRANEIYALRLNKRTETEKTFADSWQTPVAAIVTGGLGALGYEVSSWLAKHGTQYLLLVGNTELPPREKWKDALDARLRTRINYIQDLEVQGVHVYYAAVDVADKQAMMAAVQAAEVQWHTKIAAVFHLAGVTTDSIMVEQTTQDLLKHVYKPKVQGTLILHELFKDRALSCFVMFSSTSAIPYFGTNGLIAYAAANAFMDGFAHYRRSLGLAALSINWTAWAEKGMGFEYKHDALLAMFGMTTLPVSKGLIIMRKLLIEDINNALVMKVDWHKFFQINSHLKTVPYFNQLVQNVPETINSISKNKYYSHFEIISLLTECLAKLLIMEAKEINSDTPLQNYGLDSIVGLNFIAQLNLTFPDKVRPTDLYRYATVNQLANYIFNQQEVIDITPGKFINRKADELLSAEIAQLSDSEVATILETEIAEVEALIN